MDRFLTGLTRTTTDEGGAPAAKRQRAAAPAPAVEGAGDPLTVVCLNLDGLTTRLLRKREVLHGAALAAAEAAAAAHANALFTHLHAVADAPPDVICLSEVCLRVN
jgi:hypothetical protein